MRVCCRGAGAEAGHAGGGGSSGVARVGEQVGRGRTGGRGAVHVVSADLMTAVVVLLLLLIRV